MGKLITIGLFGASGRMGSAILSAIRRRGEAGEGWNVGFGVVSEEDSKAGTAIDGIALPLITAEPGSELESVDVLIDFSSPKGTLRALEAAYQYKKPLLVGTTGLPESYDPFFQKVGTVAPFIRASNTSVGVAVLTRLAADAARMLGPEFEVELVEAHHKMKKDSPSGTAITLARAVASAREQLLEKVMVKGRDGGELARKPEEIGIHAVRGGDVVGEHTVYFYGMGERIELGHRVTNREIFADGALRAANWLVEANGAGRRGAFSMQDVISI